VQCYTAESFFFIKNSDNRKKMRSYWETVSFISVIDSRTKPSVHNYYSFRKTKANISVGEMYKINSAKTSRRDAFAAFLSALHIYAWEWVSLFAPECSALMNDQLMLIPTAAIQLYKTKTATRTVWRRTETKSERPLLKFQHSASTRGQNGSNQYGVTRITLPSGCA
jgi:hypothetical protein